MRKFSIIESVINQVEGAMEVQREAFEEYFQCFAKGDKDYIEDLKRTEAELEVLDGILAQLKRFRSEQLGLPSTQTVEVLLEEYD